MKNCPFCDAKVEKVFYNEFHCTNEYCFATFRFSLCSVDAHAERLFDTRVSDKPQSTKQSLITKVDVDAVSAILEIAVKVDGYPKEILESFKRIKEVACPTGRQ